MQKSFVLQMGTDMMNAHLKYQLKHAHKIATMHATAMYHQTIPSAGKQRATANQVNSRSPNRQ